MYSMGLDILGFGKNSNRTINYSNSDTRQRLKRGHALISKIVGVDEVIYGSSTVNAIQRCALRIGYIKHIGRGALKYDVTRNAHR